MKEVRLISLTTTLIGDSTNKKCIAHIQIWPSSNQRDVKCSTRTITVVDCFQLTKKVVIS